VAAQETFLIIINAKNILIFLKRTDTFVNVHVFGGDNPNAQRLMGTRVSGDLN